LLRFVRNDTADRVIVVMGCVLLFSSFRFAAEEEGPAGIFG